MANDESKAQDNYEGYRFCRNQGHDDFLRRSALSYDFYANRQWSAEEQAEMRETNRPTITVNQTFRTLDSIVGEMLYSTGDVRFTPSSIDAQDDAADAMDKIWVNTNQISRTEFFEPQVLLDGMLTGRGYYDIRVEFDQQLMGQIKIGRKRPQNIVLNPQIASRDPDKWPEVYETRYTSIDEISLMYGSAAAEEIKQAGQGAFLCPEDRYEERLLSNRIDLSAPTGFDLNRSPDAQNYLKTRRLIERQYRVNKYKNFFVEPSTGDMSEVPENWDRNRVAAMVEAAGVQVIKRRCSTIRWMVTCDRFVLHDEDSPYNHFTIVPFFPWFVDGYTMSMGENLVDMQRMMNKLYSQYLHILNSAANSGWKVKSGTLLNMTEEELETKGAKTGLIAVVNDMAGLERIEPGTLPAGHDHLASTVRAMFDDVSGYTQTMKGADRADAAGKAIDAKITRGSVNLATAYNAIYHAKTMLAERTLDLAQTYYTETRYVRIADGSGQPSTGTTLNQPTPEGSFLNNICVGKYMVSIVPSTQRETVDQNAFDQLVKMREDLGVKIPDSVLIQYSALPDKKNVQTAIQNAGGTPQQQAQAQQLEQQMQQAELEDKQASAMNSRAQAELAIARSGKANADAQSDPNAARLQMDQARLNAEQNRDDQANQLKQRGQDIDAATKLTDIELKHQRESKKMELDAAAKKTQAAAKPKAAPKSKQPR
jgi:hypothetical protein